MIAYSSLTFIVDRQMINATFINSQQANECFLILFLRIFSKDWYSFILLTIIIVNDLLKPKISIFCSSSLLIMNLSILKTTRICLSLLRLIRQMVNSWPSTIVMYTKFKSIYMIFWIITLYHIIKQFSFQIITFNVNS
jgi:hypothetical protein